MKHPAQGRRHPEASHPKRCLQIKEPAWLELHGTAWRQKVVFFHFTQRRLRLRSGPKYNRILGQGFNNVSYFSVEPRELVFNISVDRRLGITESCFLDIWSSRAVISWKRQALFSMSDWVYALLLREEINGKNWFYLPGTVSLPIIQTRKVEYLGNSSESSFHGKFQCRRQAVTLTPWGSRGFFHQDWPATSGRFRLPRWIDANN